MYKSIKFYYMKGWCSSSTAENMRFL